MKACLKAVNRRKAIVNEISDIEQSIVQLADKYRTVGNAEKCVHYLEIVESVQNRNDFCEIKKECNEQLIQREKERKSIKLWSTVLITSILIFAVLITTSAIKSYNENIPYDNFKRDIENQTLIKDMFSYDLRGENNSYYEVAKTEKGKNIIIDYLSDYKACDDIQSALWLLYTTGEDDIMEKSFNRWIIEYGESNGEKSTNQEGKDDYWYAIYYEVDKYVIITSSVEMYEHLSVTKWNRTTQ